MNIKCQSNFCGSLKSIFKIANEWIDLFSFKHQSLNNQHQTLIIEEFEPDVFRQLIEYIHTGCVTLQPRTLLGIEYIQTFLNLFNISILFSIS